MSAPTDLNIDHVANLARIALTAEERKRQPQAGGVFRLRPGVSGRPANLFGTAG